MRHFAYRNGEMFAEDVPLREIAAEVGTPVYVYSTATLKRHYSVFMEAFEGRDALVAFSVKANSNIAVLATLAEMGAGADVVSGGELYRALKAGIPADKIVFSGVGKTREEMLAGLKAGIRQFNVESRPEMKALAACAKELGLEAPVSIRVNPDVGAGGHAKITTGKKDNKFGVAWADAETACREAHELGHIRLVGLDMHIGSQISELAPFEEALKRMIGLYQRLNDQGYNLTSLDLGGGLGVPYGDSADPPLPRDYGQMVSRMTEGMDVSLIFEPGRMIAGNAGILLSRVTYVKEAASRNFMILDAAMNDLIRPALYDAYHHIEPVMETGAGETTYDVVGPICETGDTFAKDRTMATVAAGDLVVFHTAGAYGAVQAGQYNTRPLVPEVLVNGDKFEVIRARPTYAQMLENERLPAWLNRNEGQ